MKYTIMLIICLLLSGFVAYCTLIDSMSSETYGKILKFFGRR